MNACCPEPVEVIAADQHQSGDDCRLVTKTMPAPSRAACPVSGTLSRKVRHRTLEHLLNPPQRGAIREAQYYFCTEPMCDVVYFSNEETPAFSIADLAVRVFAKDCGDEVPVCYCFDWTRARISREIKKTAIPPLRWKSCKRSKPAIVRVTLKIQKANVVWAKSTNLLENKWLFLKNDALKKLQ